MCTKFNSGGHFLCVWLERPYQKIQNWLFNLIFDTLHNSDFFCLRLGIPFFGKFDLKIEVVCLSWNLPPTVLWRCWKWWSRSSPLRYTRNTLFRKILSKNSKWKLVKFLLQNVIPGLIQIYTEFNGQAHVFYFRAEYPVWLNLVQKLKVD